jgi:hypothetical protein
MEFLGTVQIIVFYIKTDFPISKNVKNWEWAFFLFLEFCLANFFHLSDENLACEHELNNFFFIILAK